MADESEAAAPRPDLSEIATSADGRDITVPFFGPLRQPQDTVLLSLGQRWQVYRELRRDGQVQATFQQRRLAIVGRPLVVEPGRDDAISKAAAEQLQRNLDEIAFDRATKGMSWAFFYGFGVGECMWSIQDSKVWLDGVKVRTPWRFRFSPEGELRLLTQRDAFKGETMPDRKFWVVSSGADNDDDPYGLGLAYHLYWPVYFKKRGLEFWLRALEKFGGPTAVATYPQGSPPDVVEKALAAAAAMRIDSAVAVPEGISIELKEALRGTVDQSTFHRQMNGEISKIVIGQTMTTDDGASLAQGKVHENVKEEVTDADTEELCESFQQGPARWLTEWNFPGAAVPKISRPSPEDQERVAELRKKQADTIKTMDEAGYEPEPDVLKEQYPGWRKKPEPTPPAAAAPAATGESNDNVVPFRPGAAAAAAADGDASFAEAAAREPSDAIDDFIDQLEWEPVMEPIAKAVEDVIREAGSLEAAAERLAQVFAGAADQAFVSQLAAAMLKAALAGQGGLALSAREDRAQQAAG